MNIHLRSITLIMNIHLRSITLIMNIYFRYMPRLVPVAVFTDAMFQTESVTKFLTFFCLLYCKARVAIMGKRKSMTQCLKFYQNNRSAVICH